MPLKLTDLVLEAIRFILLNVSQFFELSLSGSLLIFSLSLDQVIELVFLDLPSGKILLCLASQVSLGGFEVGDLLVALFDFIFFESDSLSQLSD